MKNVLADRPSSQNDSLESEGKSRQDVIELNRQRLSKSLINNEPSSRQTKGNQQTQNTLRNEYKSFPQHSSKASRQPSWERIRQGAIEGVQWVAFSLLAVGTIVIVLYEPSPSTKQQPSAIANNPLPTQPISPLELPTSPLPQETLPLPDTTLPQLSPQRKGLGVEPLSLNPSQKSQDEPLSVSPSLDKIPSAEPELSSEPSLSGSNPVIPSTLPPKLAPVEPPCGCEQHCHQEASVAAADQNTNPDNNSPVAELRNYFNKGWQPPAGLKQTLEYSVLLNADGTIQRILPLSNTAGQYINSTNLPMPGSQFVAPREGGENSNIYVAFSPDGKVKASLE